MSEIDPQVVLGGETKRRGILGGVRSKVEWTGLVACLLPAALLMVTAGVDLIRALAAGVVAVAAWFAWTPRRKALRGRSPVVWGAWWVRWLARRAPAVVNPDGSAPVPVEVGQIDGVDQELPDGRTVGLIRHASPATRTFWTACFEMVASRAGFDADWRFGAPQATWSRFCAALAGGRVDAVQQITHVGGYDFADHTYWVTPLLVDSDGHLAADQRLVDSYAALLDGATGIADQTRTWLVLRIPVTAGFQVESGDRGLGRVGQGQVIADVCTGVMETAASYGMALQPLSLRRLAGVVRGLLDPDWPVDKTTGLDLDSMWRPIDSRPVRKAVISGQDRQWHTRSAMITSAQIAPGRLAPDFLWPLVSNLSPSVIRTFSTLTEIEPAEVARTRAVGDVTADLRAIAAAGAVSDGSEGAQLTSSQQRLVDLGPQGGGQAGVTWASVLTYMAPTAAGLASADRTVGRAAGEARISKLIYLDGAHVGGIVTGLPLARGLRGNR